MVTYSIVIIALLQIYLLDGVSGDLTVTLAVFSGRPDPQWTIRSTDPRYNEIASQLQRAKKGKFTDRPEDMPVRLGYKGFLVQDTMKTESDLFVGSNTVPLQQLLLKTMPKGIIPKAILKSVSEEIKRGKVSANVQVTKRFAPHYFPSKWNGNRARLLGNNCYNYANDKPSNTRAQPWEVYALTRRIPYRLALNAAAVTGAAVRGLQVVNVPQPPQGHFVQNPLPRVPKEPRHLVALVFENDDDELPDKGELTDGGELQEGPEASDNENVEESEAKSREVRALGLVNLYRILRPDENPRSIVPKDITATKTVLSHVNCGSRPGYVSQYISTSASLDVARNYKQKAEGKGLTGLRICEFDVNYLVESACQLFDLTEEANRNQHLGKAVMAKNFAKASQEVLLICPSPVQCTVIE